MDNSALTPTPPLLPGLTWRAITPDDLIELVELAETCQSVDGGLAFLNQPNNLRERYFPDTPGAAIGAFAADGHLVACSTVHLKRQHDAERAAIVGQVLPEFRKRGIGTYLMRWSEVQGRALFTPDDSIKKLLQIATESRTESSSRLYEAHGFELVFDDLVMRRDLQSPLPDRPLPPDVTITTWQPELAKEFFQAYHAAFRERPGFPGYSADQWIGDRNEDEDARPAWSLLARVNDLPVGFITADGTHPAAFIVQIGVIPEQRRHGLALALMVETMRRMQAEGETAVELTVHVDNPGAIQTYIELGFREVARRARYERNVK